MIRIISGIIIDEVNDQCFKQQQETESILRALLLKPPMTDFQDATLIRILMMGLTLQHLTTLFQFGRTML